MRNSIYYDRRRSAFTLIELVIVVAVIVVLTTMVFLYLKPQERLGQAYEAKRVVVKRELKNALKQSAFEVPELLERLSEKATYRSLCKYGVPLADQFEVGYEGDESRRLCIPVDELVEENLVPAIPEDELLAEYPLSGYEARVDCVGNIQVSFIGDPDKSLIGDYNGDGAVDICDYACADGCDPSQCPPERTTADEDIEWAKQFRNACETPCGCETDSDHSVEIVFVIDSSPSFFDEWETLYNHTDDLKLALLARGFDVKTKIYSMWNGDRCQIKRDDCFNDSYLNILNFIQGDATQPLGVYVDITTPPLSATPINYPDDPSTPLNTFMRNFWDYCKFLTGTHLCEGNPSGQPDSDIMSEAWAPAAGWILNEHEWQADATKVLVILADSFPSGGAGPNDQAFDDEDQLLIDRVKALATQNEVFLLGLHGGWEGNAGMQVEIDNFFKAVTVDQCGQLIDFNQDPSSILDVAVNFMVESCLVNCDCFGQPKCSNGIVEASEECDTGGDSATCDSDCSLVDCGDSHTNTATEECDTGGIDTQTCDGGDCTAPECGDGYHNAATEECDEGDTVNGDGCSSTCQNEPSLPASG